MLAFWLRVFLLAELLLYLALAWRMTSAGRGLVMTLASITAIALSLRVIIVAITFLLARIGRSEVPRDRQIGLRPSLLMFAREVAAFSLLFAVTQPFERLLMR